VYCFRASSIATLFLLAYYPMLLWILRKLMAFYIHSILKFLRIKKFDIFLKSDSVFVLFDKFFNPNFCGFPSLTIFLNPNFFCGFTSSTLRAQSGSLSESSRSENETRFWSWSWTEDFAPKLDLQSRPVRLSRWMDQWTRSEEPQMSNSTTHLTWRSVDSARNAINATYQVSFLTLPVEEFVIFVSHC
jgi:hypothetical protein